MSIMRRIRSALGQTLDVPAASLGERVCVSTGGFFDTTVDGCEAIVDYSPSHVVLDCAGDRVVIEGDGLSVGSFTLGRVRICGRVERIVNCRADSKSGSTQTKASGAKSASSIPGSLPGATSDSLPGAIPATNHGTIPGADTGADPGGADSAHSTHGGKTGGGRL